MFAFVVLLVFIWNMATAMNDDVEDLRNKYNQLLTIAKANNKAISLNCRNIARLERQITELASYTQLLGNSIKEMLSKSNALYEYTIIGHALLAFEKCSNHTSGC